MLNNHQDYHDTMVISQMIQTSLGCRPLKPNQRCLTNVHPGSKISIFWFILVQVAVGGNTVAIPIGAHDPRIRSRTILEDDVLLMRKKRSRCGCTLPAYARDMNSSSSWIEDRYIHSNSYYLTGCTLESRAKSKLVSISATVPVSPALLSLVPFHNTTH